MQNPAWKEMGIVKNKKKKENPSIQVGIVIWVSIRVRVRQIGRGGAVAKIGPERESKTPKVMKRETEEEV
jgi:hypothetical protein